MGFLDFKSPRGHRFAGAHERAGVKTGTTVPVEETVNFLSRLLFSLCLTTLVSLSLLSQGKQEAATKRAIRTTHGPPRSSASLSLSVPGIIPRPVHVQPLPGQFRIDHDVEILAEAENTQDQFSARLLQEAIQDLGGPHLRIVSANGQPPVSAKTIVLGDPSRLLILKTALSQEGLTIPPTLRTDGYLLHASPQRVVIAAITHTGVFYGVQSLIQLLKTSVAQHRRLSIPCVSITDYPALAFRGYLDTLGDTAGEGQTSTFEDFKRIIRRLASYKLNYYVAHFVSFRFAKYPDISKSSGALPQAEWRELVSYARQYHVEIVPVLRVLSHMDSILRLPAYSHFAERPGSGVISPIKSGVYPFLQDMLGELLDVFPARYVGIGVDEAYDLGTGQSAERARFLGRADLYMSHVKRLREMLISQGRVAMMPADMFRHHYPEGVAMPNFSLADLYKLPRDIVMIPWVYLPVRQYPQVPELADAGFDQVILSGLLNWLELFPRYELSFTNIKHFTLAAAQARSLGAMTGSFEDRGGDNLRELNWYGIAFAGECAWNPAAGDAADFAHRFFPVFYGYVGDKLARSFKVLGNLDALMPRPISGTVPGFPPAVRELIGQHGFSWFGFYAEPNLGSIPRVEVEKARILAARLKEILEMLESAREQSLWNQEHLDYVSFASHRAIHVTKKVLWLDQALRLQQQGRPAEASALLERLGTEINQLREEFKRLWLRTNQPEGLQFNLDRYDRMEKRYLDEARALRTGERP